MYIFIMRHGEAANIEGKDSLRPLTKLGAIQAQRMGGWIAKYELAKLMKIFVSPYVRAQQSCANVLLAINKLVGANDIIPETFDLITPAGNTKQVHNFIDGLTVNNIADQNQAILFISHMPFVSYLVGELTNSTNMPIFATGSIAVIDYDTEKMQGQLVEIVQLENIDV
jgi:phosphohistidine phosphatase